MTASLQLKSSERHTEIPASARLFAWSVTVATVSGIGLGLALGKTPSVAPAALVGWIALSALADYQAVSIGTASFSISLPLLLAAGMATTPPLAGFIAFVGCIDPRELRGEIGISRALFNRSEVALSVMAGSAVFHLIGGDLLSWPSVVVAAALCMAADCLVNVASVASSAALARREPFIRTAMSLFPTQGLGAFVSLYLCLGLTGLIIAVAYSVGGAWGLLVSFAPVFFAAKVLEREHRLAEAREDLRRKDEGLVAATKRMELERRDERGVLAGSLHDDVLPPLFKVQLMADVVRRDLEGGALLDLETDLPAMLEAAEATSEAIRDLIGDLRRSTLGPGGLIPTLRLRVRDIESRSTSRVQLQIRCVPSDPLVELVAYQVAREAADNAAVHGNARLVIVELTTQAGGYRVTVTDDGEGFDPVRKSPEGHFGLSLMGERVKAIGGTLDIQSEPGRGCVVRAWLPPTPAISPPPE